jgi:hypothetical protein
MARDYQKERAYDSQPEVKAKRAARNRARYAAVKAGIIKPGSKMDVGHIDGNAMNTGYAKTGIKLSNLKAETPHANRSYPRTKTAAKKNPKD